MKRPIKIAIADDHAGFKQGIETVLNFSPDMKLIVKADHGADLLRLIKGNMPDVVLLDLQMPVLDGFATLPQIKNLYPGIKVIILTLNAEASEVANAFHLGADAYLLKTSDPEMITKTIRQCFENDPFVARNANPNMIVY